MNKDLSAAKAYGQALFLAAKENGVVDAVLADARELEERSDPNGRMAALLRAPHILRERKIELTRRALASVEPLLLNFILLLLRKDRILVFSDALAVFKRMAEEEAGVQAGVLTSATRLGQDQRAALHAALEARTGLKLTIEYKVDPALLGGVVFKSGDLLIDNSLASALARLRSRLMAVRVI